MTVQSLDTLNRQVNYKRPESGRPLTVQSTLTVQTKSSVQSWTLCSVQSSTCVQSLDALYAFRGVVGLID